MSATAQLKTFAFHNGDKKKRTLAGIYAPHEDETCKRWSQNDLAGVLRSDMGRTGYTRRPLETLSGVCDVGGVRCRGCAMIGVAVGITM